MQYETIEVTYAACCFETQLEGIDIEVLEA